MTPDRLLAVFDRISDAPDAIPRLRQFILDLAVRGKLVAQDPSEESASKLLTRFRNEMSQSLRTKLKYHQTDDNYDRRQFELPQSWVWCRLAEVGSIVGGGTPPSNDLDNFTEGGQGIAWLTPADLGRERSLYIEHGARDLTSQGLHSSSATIMPKGSVLFTSRAPIGYIAIAVNEVSTNQGFKSIVPFIPEMSLFISTYLRAFANWIDSIASGTTFKEVSGKIVANLPFPLPPLPEQHRIVARVDELMALCDQLEATQAKREARRDRLVAASLQRLNQPAADAPTFREDARFYLNHLPRLTVRPEHVQQLRQTILNLAVRGRLVAQDPNDEPVEKLLSRVDIYRRSLLKQGYPNTNEASSQLRKQAEQSLPDNLESLPAGWQWTTLMQCSYVIIDCHNKTAPYSTTGIPLVRTTNVRNGLLNFNDIKYVDELTYTKWSARCQPEPGDILITREAPMGEVCIIPEGLKICLGQRMMLSRLIPGTVEPRFLLYSLRDPYLMDRVQDKPVGATVQHLRVGGVESLLVPLPPIKEQHRIVAKVDELMTLCDRLEAQLTTTHDTNNHLLEAVLQEALAGQYASVSA